jgi:competence ComEA-like helix-hairpin-helix protein
VLSATPAHSAAAQAATIRETFRPLDPGERVDVDRAPDRELARLPRVSLALARRIVADRQERGPFRSLEGLDRVPGIGPRTLERLGPHITFSGISGRLLTGVADSLLPPPDSLVRVNLAGVRELRTLPGIGPRRAEAILAWRGRHGFFTEASDLAKVPGVSANMVKTFDHRLDFTTP